jgi:hypothetical protein
VERRMGGRGNPVRVSPQDALSESEILGESIGRLEKAVRNRTWGVIPEVVEWLRKLEAQALAGVHRNPTLAILGNPGVLSESATLEEIIAHVKAGQSLSALERLRDLLFQVRKGIHRNPRRKKLARKVLAIDYVHASDGKKYTHDFTEDRDHGPVCAVVEDGGKRVVLEAADGRAIVHNY